MSLNQIDFITNTFLKVSQYKHGFVINDLDLCIYNHHFYFENAFIFSLSDLQ